MGRRLIPFQIVAEMMSKRLGSEYQADQETIYFVQEALSEFIGCITSQAHDLCKARAPFRKPTITTDDILGSVRLLGMGIFELPLNKRLNEEDVQEEAVRTQPSSSLYSVLPSQRSG